MTNIPDNSKFEAMVKNRPSLSIIPSVNKRIISQYIGRNIFTLSAIFVLGITLTNKFWNSTFPDRYLKTKKSYNFEFDPYSGKVSCIYNEVRNNIHDY